MAVYRVSLGFPLALAAALQSVLERQSSGITFTARRKSLFLNLFLTPMVLFKPALSA
jgi:hypothetical protein